ncbi:MAG: transposase [Deltaproteobacteria bacterium]|nr:transposase [Deltaproteobacteria bacterium]
MARAKRHFIPGHIWHITHRCHKREYLLKFSKDRRRYLQWLYQARKRYGLAILNYMVTSNHIHLLVVDTGEGNAIPQSIQLVAGRTGQEYNQRKSRKGAFWEDRYHATAVESGEHLLRCIAYIDTNMVRAGVVDHPSMWRFSGYNEIQRPKRKNILIDYERLQWLVGARSYDQLRSSHQGWIEEYLSNGAKSREEEWTASIAVGSMPFVDKVKSLLGFRAKGRSSKESDEGYQLREAPARYNAHFGAKNVDIGPENLHSWDVNPE